MSNKPSPEDLSAIVEELLGGRAFASIDELNSHLARRTQEYNHLPQADLGGLSPHQMSRLLNGDWLTSGAQRLNERITLGELAGAGAFADARTILAHVSDHAPLKETTARNFTRATVATLLPRLRLHNERRAKESYSTPARNEDDIYWLGELHFILMTAGLLMRRRGLRLTKLAQQLVADSRAGELYALIFRTLFRQVDLRMFDRRSDHLGLQSTIAYSFFRLGEVARDWTWSEDLAESAWLASAKDAPNEVDLRYGDMRHYTFQHRVLTPLTHFGLLEVLELPGEEKWNRRYEYRVSPLFDRFLSFKFE